MPGQNSILPDHIKEINNLNLPLADEFLLTTTVAYCNVYSLLHKMFICAGLPINNLVVSDNKVAATLISDNSVYSSYIDIYLPMEFLKLRSATNTIENLVFENIDVQHITNTEDINIGLKLWKSIQDAMDDFMNIILFTTNQINEGIIDKNIQQDSISTEDPITMRNLYFTVFNQTIETIFNSTESYKNAFIFLKKFYTEFKINNKQVSRYLVN